MPRSTVRLAAFFVLALLGAPVTMHVVMHDLHAHHDGRVDAALADSGHGDHEHPLVASSSPQVRTLARAGLPVLDVPASMPAFGSHTARMERNVIAHGALRSDEDVGLRLLLSTFLI